MMTRPVTFVCPAESVCGRDDGVEFRGDGTFTNTFSGGQSMSSNTWTLNGDQLRQTFTESRIDYNEDGDFNDPDEIDRDTDVVDVRVSLAGSDLTVVYSDPEVGDTTATLRFRRR
jgi:hypothetical protein